MQDWTHYRKGFVRIRLYTDSPERFLNLCAYHGIDVWNLVNRAKLYEMNVTAKDFLQLKGICRKTRVRVKIIEKCGLPFFFYRNKKRKAFFIGIFLSFCILMFLSQYIWNIHVTGNVHNSTQSILNYLEKMEVSHGTAKKNLDCAKIARKLREEFSDITWVSAKISGSRLILEMKENRNIYEAENPAKNACDLVSDKAGTIVSMITRKGTPLRKKGDFCKKGEVLVSGKLDILNDNKEVVRTEYAQADADVYICYKLNYYQEFSMFYEKPVYTGARKKGYLLQIGNYYFSFKRKTKWAAYDTVTDLKQMKITENFKLPVFYGKSEDFAYEKQAFTYSKKEAEAKAAENLRVLLQSLTEKGVQISENHVKIGIHNGICTAKGILTVIEKTGKKSPVQNPTQPTERNTDVNE